MKRQIYWYMYMKDLELSVLFRIKINLYHFHKFEHLWNLDIIPQFMH